MISLIIASLAFFLVGLAFFITSIIKNKTGISAKEFISAQYLMVKIPFSSFKKKTLLLRRLSIPDVVEIGSIPNWLQVMLLAEKPEEESKKSIEILNQKSEIELLQETKEYFDLLQKVAEKSIVKYEHYVKQWQEIDPSYTGRLPDITLQAIFNEIMNPSKNAIKKKTSYNVLRLLEKYIK